MASNALLVLPNDAQTQVIALMSKLPDNVQMALKGAIPYVSEDLIKGCTSADEVLELLKYTAEQRLTDQQIKYRPAVWSIDHKDQRFKDDQGNNLGEDIAGVILHFQPNRAFFLEGRDLPICSAMGQWMVGKAADDAQEAWSQYKLFNPEMLITWSGQEHKCSECPFNQFGSDPKTGAGKACKEKYRNFLVPVDEDGEFTGEGIMLNTPVTSIGEQDDYISRLQRYKPKGKNKVEPKTTLHVVTGFHLVEAKGQGQAYSKINFKAQRLLTTEEFFAMARLRQQIKAVADTIEINYGETYGKQNDDAGTGSMGSEVQLGGNDPGVGF
jgi:hypothetical protein